MATDGWKNGSVDHLTEIPVVNPRCGAPANAGGGKPSAQSAPGGAHGAARPSKRRKRLCFGGYCVILTLFDAIQND